MESSAEFSEFKLDKLDGEQLFNKMNDYIDQAELDDKSAKSVTEPIITKILGEKECPVQNCQLRLTIPELKRQLNEEKKKVRDLTKENEDYRGALEKSASPDKREQCIIKATKDHLVQTMLVKYQHLEVELSRKDLEIQKLRQYAEEATAQKNEYVSTIEADKNLKEKYQRMKIIEEQTRRMLAQQEDAQTRFNKYDSEYRSMMLKMDKLVGVYNERVKQYTHIMKLIQDSEKVAKGFNIAPVEPIQEKKKGFFGFMK